MEAEFAALWQDAYPLPDAILHKIHRIAQRVEISWADSAPQHLPAAAIAESPIYRSGKQLYQSPSEELLGFGVLLYL